jgi:choline dehydrogenase-like flavoprotein
MANSHCLGGTSGSVLASRLAASRRAPKVLLLEAGGRNDPGRLRSPELRFSAAYTEPELVRQHSTVAQPQLNCRKFWNGRGFGLGGTTAINFGFWTLGSEVDYNEWARLVDDDCWKWEGINGVKARFRKIENLHANFSEEQARYLSQDLANEHSRDGKVDVSYSPITYLEAMVFAAARETQVSVFEIPFIAFGLTDCARSKSTRISTLATLLAWGSHHLRFTKVVELLRPLRISDQYRQIYQY